MAIALELLAPARNLDIGIAAIDCGADAVYMAGPAFGARQAAGNSLEDMRSLCGYAHDFGAKIYATVNTIIFEDELDAALQMIRGLADAGVDALIVQDMAVPALVRRAGVEIPLHASTQCAVSAKEKAEWLYSNGFSRLILERQMSLGQIRDIRESLPHADLEFFVHGALCVSYSGQCYLSEYLASRSANRGACAQACRSRYDLVDSEGRVLVKDKALLSLKDYRLEGRLKDLADAGVSSFKIEGRLKNISYVRNVVRAYSEALDRLVTESGGKYRRSSFGHTVNAFEPSLEKTFNRGYTEFFLDGARGKWASMDAAKGMGEHIGRVVGFSPDKTELTLDTGKELSNGDGFSFVSRGGEIIGFRGDVCAGRKIRTKAVPQVYVGADVFRNLDADFERRIEARPGRRIIPAEIKLSFTGLVAKAVTVSEDGRSVEKCFDGFQSVAENQDRMLQTLFSQLSKTSGRYGFRLAAVTHDGPLPFMRISDINEIRREMASLLDSLSCTSIPPAGSVRCACGMKGKVNYLANVSNSLAKDFYESSGLSVTEPAYEISHREGAELMRTKYCIRHELGMCLKEKGHPGPLYLLNNGRRLALHFDCSECEMTVTADPFSPLHRS